MLTAKGHWDDLAAGVQAGVDDEITNPFKREGLRARVQVGARMVRFQQTLADRVTALEKALSPVKRLSGLLPICSY